MNDYVTNDEFKELKEEVDDIRDNHLQSIYTSIQFIWKDIGNLRWWIMGSVAVLGIVLAILQVFG